MCDTWSDGPQNFLALSTIKHIPYFWAAKASSTDNACLILGVMAAKLHRTFTGNAYFLLWGRKSVAKLHLVTHV